MISDLLNRISRIERECRQIREMLLSSGSAEPKDFEIFWNLYPVKTDHDDALVAWKTHIKQTDVPAILKAVRNAIWNEKKFIPHAHRWLKNKRWLEQKQNEHNGKYERLSETV